MTLNSLEQMTKEEILNNNTAILNGLPAVIFDGCRISFSWADFNYTEVKIDSSSMNGDFIEIELKNGVTTPIDINFLYKTV